MQPWRGKEQMKIQYALIFCRDPAEIDASLLSSGYSLEAALAEWPWT